MNRILKTPAKDDNVYTAPIMTDKDVLEFVRSSKNIIDADSDDQNEMNDVAPDPTSSEMRNIRKNRGFSLRRWWTLAEKKNAKPSDMSWRYLTQQELTKSSDPFDASTKVIRPT
ncbi:hypothetical protein TNCV_2370571 [Trichonephila clavipes]|nr:hypothetical protein TNCV_2370571 [Trichonephila clavipes]